jgi:hypothetical protein
MDRTGTFNGLQGRREVKKGQIETKTNFGDPKEATANRNFKINKYPMYKRVFFSQATDYSTRTEVLPCFSQNKFHPRNPPQFSNTHGLQPLTGLGKHQEKGFVNTRAVSTTYLKPRSNVIASQPTKIAVGS